ncbi:GTPase-associated protein 1-related protein [Saccharothrix violaceirubra]|uniref:Uncharacterized protein n=1 Tax=Saccharothrix violaceirubra TaxID=413306 RepID=A0A7W7WYW5_9PSEU|nr:GTPase-associated protein 1-related protein [Saccharothrix violaceirubra]MBB4968163.1 hypothetical protein [Saccharothrix violaceirubra]
MTVRQLHYTSCEDGLEGIQGFQVSAMTPGVPKPLSELAVRASVYEAGPSFVARLRDGDLDEFPVAFGYVPQGRSGVLFQSRYAGADFTGRLGNYFAHALLVDDVAAELGDVLPIDLWRSPAWVHGRLDGTSLPELTGLPAGTAVTPDRVRALVTAGGTGNLERVLGAVQRLLAAGRGRLVLVVRDDETAARWLAAACRSLPRELGLRISFVTYTSRPEEAPVLVCGTTPDVRLPAYGDFTTVSLLEPAPRDPDGTRYASALAQLWERDQVDTALALAAQASPALTAPELDAFAVLLELALDLAAAAPPDESTLLTALRLGVDRMPRGLPAAAWQRVADQVLDAGGPQDVAAWAELLRAAHGNGEPVPSTLYGTYFVASLTAPQRHWQPTLAQADLTDVAENVVLPALLDGRSPALVERLVDHRDLVRFTADALDRRLADQRETRHLATTLKPEVVRLLVANSRSGRVRLLADLVLARSGELDPVKVMAEATRFDSVEWQHLGPVLWPQDPSTEESVRLLRDVPTRVLVESRLGQRIVARALEHSARPDLKPEEGRLIEEVLRSPVAADLGERDQAGLNAARRIAHFATAKPGRGAAREVLTALDDLSGLTPEQSDRLRTALAGYVLRADAGPHLELLGDVLALHARPFLPAYRNAVREELAKAPYQKVAEAIVVWWGLEQEHVRRTLVDETLPLALRRRRRRYLDKVGGQLQVTAKRLGVDPPRPSWPGWWQNWRARKEKRGFFGFAFDLLRGKKEK